MIWITKGLKDGELTVYLYMPMEIKQLIYLKKCNYKCFVLYRNLHINKLENGDLFNRMI